MPNAKQDAAIKSWLDNARSDFELACVKKTRKIRYEHLCFHAQQAAEKSIKALFLSLNDVITVASHRTQVFRL